MCCSILVHSLKWFPIRFSVCLYVASRAMSFGGLLGKNSVVCLCRSLMMVVFATRLVLSVSPSGVSRQQLFLMGTSGPMSYFPRQGSAAWPWRHWVAGRASSPRLTSLEIVGWFAGKRASNCFSNLQTCTDSLHSHGRLYL